MLLAVEIDNSEIAFGLFDANDELTKKFIIAANLSKTSDEYAVSISLLLEYSGIERADITDAIISSVVPQLTDVLATAVRSLVEVEIITVGKGIKTGFSIKIDNPSDLGADLVANAAAVIGIKEDEDSGAASIIVDMGTATTIFAVNSSKEYIGGSILPGIQMSIDALHLNTALLPTVTPTQPLRAVGKNSQESVRSGVIMGNAIMIDGFIDKFVKEMKCNNAFEVFITGKYAQLVIPACEHTMRYVPELTLQGLCRIYRNNIKS